MDILKNGEELYRWIRKEKALWAKRRSCAKNGGVNCPGTFRQWCAGKHLTPISPCVVLM